MEGRMIRYKFTSPIFSHQFLGLKKARKCTRSCHSTPYNNVGRGQVVKATGRLMFPWRAYCNTKNSSRHVISLLKSQITCKSPQHHLQLPNLMNSSKCHDSLNNRKHSTQLIKKLQRMPRIFKEILKLRPGPSSNNSTHDRSYTRTGNDPRQKFMFYQRFNNTNMESTQRSTTT
uniref:Uncharacterized protein n=1 Tax=Opuntia streptacantha TaxID=393608 RepID=A0A7C9AEQ2_OPUST